MPSLASHAWMYLLVESTLRRDFTLHCSGVTTGSADHRFCGPRPFGLVTGRSNSRTRVGRYPGTVHDQTATFLLLLGAHTGVLVAARPSPIFRAADQPGLDGIQVDIPLAVFLDGAQGPVEACPEPSRREPGLPQFYLLASKPVDRAHREKTRTAKAAVRATS